jgi:hypothetical protein
VQKDVREEVCKLDQLIRRIQDNLTANHRHLEVLGQNKGRIVLTVPSESERFGKRRLSRTKENIDMMLIQWLLQLLVTLAYMLVGGG